MAVLTGGAMKCWGNNNGQLGDGTTTDRTALLMLTCRDLRVCVHCSYQRRRGDCATLLQVGDVPAGVQLGVHNLGDELVHCRDSDRRNVRSPTIVNHTPSPTVVLVSVSTGLAT